MVYADAHIMGVKELIPKKQLYVNIKHGRTQSIVFYLILNQQV
jgi:hypothetical protein